MTRHLIAGILIVLAGYGLLEARPLLVGPSLAISSPKNDATLPGGVLSVYGRAARTVALSLDGMPVIPDQNGTFTTSLILPKGGDTLTFTATDQFGRSITETRSVYVP